MYVNEYAFRKEKKITVLFCLSKTESTIGLERSVWTVSLDLSTL